MEKMNTHLARVRWASVFAACAMLTAGTLPSLAFQVKRVEIRGYEFTGLPVHEDITRQGLLKKSFRVDRTGSTIVFSDVAVRAIQDANVQVDSSEWEDEEFHADNDSFPLSNQRIVEAQAAIVAAANNARYADARQKLGASLHILQDFYSHSTWIETQNGAAVMHPDFGTSAFRATATPNSGCTEFSIKPSTDITSGYFSRLSLPQVKTGSVVFYTNLTPGFPLWRCLHGGSHVASDALLGAGINKDTHVRAGHQSAKQAAVDATARFVDEIVRQLKSDDALCGFLDAQKSAACGTVSDDSTFQFAFDPFPSAPRCFPNPVSPAEYYSGTFTLCLQDVRPSIRCLGIGCTNANGSPRFYVTTTGYTYTATNTKYFGVGTCTGQTISEDFTHNFVYPSAAYGPVGTSYTSINPYGVYAPNSSLYQQNTFSYVTSVAVVPIPNRPNPPALCLQTRASKVNKLRIFDFKRNTYFDTTMTVDLPAEP